MKKILSLLLTLFLFCSCFTSCSNQHTSSNDEQSNKAKVIDVADFGAKGDGVTDDYKAISSAINEARQSDNGATIKFKSDSTYRIEKSFMSDMAMELTGLKNVTLQGDNTTIMIDGYQQYLTTIGSENLTISGFNFKYEKNIYTLSDVLDISLKDMTMTIQSEESLGIDSSWVSPLFESDNNFGIVNDEKERQHLFFNTVDVVDAEKHIYKLHISNRDGDVTISRLANIKNNNYKFVTPMPNVGQIESSAFTVYNSKNVTFENCNVWDASYFVFSIRYCEDKVSFINTNLVPEPGSAGVMMSWRDQFHCKDNRAQLIWKDCTIKAAYDDTLNLACTISKVTEVASPKEIVTECPELGGTYPVELKKGDSVTLYNADNGLFCGKTEIEEVVEPNRFILKDKLDNLTVGVTVAVDSLTSPDSLVENCTIEGTLRVQTKMTFKDTKFKLYDAWIRNAGWTDAEGTLPNDVLFKNCSFSGYSDKKYIMVGTETATYVAPKYFVKNVVFEDCELNLNNLQVDEGNDVKVIKDGVVQYSSMK